MKKRTMVSGIIMAAAMYGYLCAGESDVWTAKFMIGTVTIKKENTNSWIALKLNDMITQNDSLKTGVESRVDLENTAGDMLAIGANFRGNPAMATAPNRIPEKTSWLLKLFKGREAIEMSSPTAVAAIRGKMAEQTGEQDAEKDRNAERIERESHGIKSHKDRNAIQDIRDK